MSFNFTNPEYNPKTALKKTRWIFKELLDRGASEAQLYSLFQTYAVQWLCYFIFGYNSPISDAISNDVVHPWLNASVGGKKVRDHIIDRLSNT